MADVYANAPYLDATAAVRQLNFLAGVNVNEVKELFVESVREVELFDGQLLCEQDSAIERVWLVLEGTVRQFRRELDARGKPRQLLVREVGPDTIVGIYDFLFENTYRTRASAVTRCRLLAIEAKALSRLIYRYPDMRGRLAPLDIIGRLSTFPLLQGVEPVGLGFLADALEQKQYKPGDVLYRSGDVVDRVFLLSQGQVELRWSASLGAPSHWVGNGGVLGLSEGTAANESVTVQHDCVVSLPATIFGITRNSFVTISGLVPDRPGLAAIAEVEERIAGMSVFASFSDEQRLRLAGYFSHNYYPSNHLLIQQNEVADSLWVLMPHSNAIIRALDATGRSMLDTTISGPTYFAETALLGQIPQDSTVEADAGSEWLRLHWRDFEAFDAIDPADLRALLRIKSPKTPVMVGKEARRNYPWLQPGESVAYFSRRHWVAFLGKNFLTFAFLLMIVAFAIVGNLLPGAQLWVIATVILLSALTIGALVWGYIDYRNDWLVVTNQRVVYQEKLLFVHVWRKEAPLESIQSLDFARGLLGRWLGYGTLVVRTAGTAGEIRFSYTTNFDQLRSIIKAQQEQRKRHAAAQSKLNIHRQLERRLGLIVEPPSRVSQNIAPPKEPETWRTRIKGRQGLGIAWQEGNRLVWRKHWMALLPMIGWSWLTPFFVILLGLGYWALYTQALPGEWEGIAAWMQWLLIFLFLVFLGRLIWVIVDWYNDTYEVSDTEVVNVRKLPFGLREDRRSAPLARIQNVETSIPSPIHLLLGYGNVIIQTAAEFGTLIFYSVPDPASVTDEIVRRMEQGQKRQEEEEARRRAQDLPDWFEMYSRLETSAADRTRP